MEEGLTWEEAGGYPCTLDQASVAGGDREGGPRGVGGKVLKTHFVVSKSTLTASAQNCTKHIQEKTHYIWGSCSKHKTVCVPLK